MRRVPNLNEKPGMCLMEWVCCKTDINFDEVPNILTFYRFPEGVVGGAVHVLLQGCSYLYAHMHMCTR